MEKIRKVFKSNEWIKYTRDYINDYKRRNNFDHILNYQDWEDISQDILIHIWKKKSKYDSKQPLKPWLKTIILRQISNKLRQRGLKYPYNRNFKIRKLFNYPKSLFTAIKEDNVLNEQETKFVYDRIDDRDPSYSTKNINLLQGLVPDKDFKILKTLLSSGSVNKCAKRYRVNPSCIYWIVAKTRKRWKSLSDEPVF